MTLQDPISKLATEGDRRVQLDERANELTPRPFKQGFALSDHLLRNTVVSYADDFIIDLLDQEIVSKHKVHFIAEALTPSKTH